MIKAKFFALACGLTITLGIGNNILAAPIPWDCDVINGSAFAPQNTFPIVQIKRTDSPTLKHSRILDLKSLNVIFLNLKKNCCENKEFNERNVERCKTDEAYFQDNNDKVPKSFYLFDHVFDVLMRRLDGEIAGENCNSLYKDVTPDPKGAEWRERINEKAELLSGTVPSVINNKYQEFRKVDTTHLLTGLSQDSTRSIQEYRREMTAGENLNILQNYDTLTLAERYENTCNLAGYIYFLFRDDDNLGSVIETKSMLLNSSRCKNTIKARIDNETTYVKVVDIARSQDFQTDSVNEFLTYLYQRLTTLWDSIRKLTTTFERVERAVPELTEICMP